MNHGKRKKESNRKTAGEKKLKNGCCLCHTSEFLGYLWPENWNSKTSKNYKRPICQECAEKDYGFDFVECPCCKTQWLPNKTQDESDILQHICETCEKGIPECCVKVTGCQTTDCICVACFDGKCYLCKTNAIEGLDDFDLFLWGGDPLPACFKCKPHWYDDDNNTVTKEISNNENWQDKDWVKDRKQQLLDCLFNLKVIPIRDVCRLVTDYCHGWVWLVTNQGVGNEVVLNPLQMVDDSGYGGHVLDLIPVTSPDRSTVLFDGLYRLIRRVWEQDLQRTKSIIDCDYFELPIYRSDVIIHDIEWSDIQHVWHPPQHKMVKHERIHDNSGKRKSIQSVWKRRQVSDKIIQPQLYPFDQTQCQLSIKIQDPQSPTIFHQDYPKSFAEWNEEENDEEQENDKHHWHTPKAYLYDMYCISLVQSTDKQYVGYNHLYPTDEQPIIITSNHVERFQLITRNKESKGQSFVKLHYMNKKGKWKGLSKNPPCRIAKGMIQDASRWIFTGDSYWFRFPCNGSYKLTVTRPHDTQDNHSLFGIMELVNIQISTNNHLHSQHRFDLSTDTVLQTISISNVENLLASFQFNQPFDSVFVLIEQIN